MEKKTYEKLEVEVIRFDAEDVITTSELLDDDCPNNLADCSTVYFA